MSTCAHNSSQHSKETCFNKSSIVNIAKIINSRSKFKINIRNNKHTIWNELLNTPYIKCNYTNEVCDINHTILESLDNQSREIIELYTYKPILPKGKYRWLSNFDIEFVMKQFHKKFKSFTFLGAVPCDYFLKFPNKFPNDLPTTKLGIIFNTDRLYKPGEHWVSVFINRNTKTIEYFDSNGDLPNKCIQKFLDSRFKDYSFKHNTKAFQKNNYACGIYAIHFLVSRLNGLSFNKLVQHELIGDDLQQFNNKHFYFI